MASTLLLENISKHLLLSKEEEDFFTSLLIERYNNFCQLYPTLIECLPQKQIASYIGVTPEFLSSILSKAKMNKAGK